jgi:hypothetical protein
MKKKTIIFFSIISVLALAVCYAAFFYLSQIEIIYSEQNAQYIGRRAASYNGLPREIENQKLSRPEPKKEKVYLKDFLKFKEELVSAQSDFLEVNLYEMKISFYATGSLKNEFPILAKGDPQGWGGSASGLYQVISGNQASYSLAAEVYMPFALRYYGKYYIHGEPYYPGGGKRYTDATGGCVQLSDADAKAVYNLAEIGMPVLVIDKQNDGYEYPAKKTSQFPEISAESFLVADLDSGFVFSKKDSKEKWPTASLAKLMTAIVAAENIDLRNSIQVTPAMLGAFGETSGLEAGKTFRVVELFYPLLIESSNDVAQVLSYFLGQQKTIKLMNEKAKAIMMENTTFVGPDGFSAENVSTAEDLFYLTRYILDNRPLLLEITKDNKVQAFGEVRFENLNNKNLFFENDNFIGGKTGYLTASRYSGIFIFRFSAENNLERRIAIILLGSPKLDEGPDSLKGDTEEIINWLKNIFF